MVKVEFTIEREKPVRLVSSMILSSHAPVDIGEDRFLFEIYSAEYAAFRSDGIFHGSQLWIQVFSNFAQF